MTITRMDRPLITARSSVPAAQERERAEGRRITNRGPAAAIVRSFVAVVLAMMAVLVLLPAALAAQAASAF